MSERELRLAGRTSLVALGLTLVLVAALDLGLIHLGYRNQVDTVLDPQVWPFIAAVILSGGVGAVIVDQHPRHRVGWLFLAVAASVVVAAILGEWYSYGCIVQPSKVAGCDIAGFLGDKAFLPWFPLVTLVLLLTPNGEFLTPRWRLLGRICVAATLAAFLASVFSNAELEVNPLSTNPFAVEALNPAVQVVALACLLVAALCLMLSAVGLIVRFRRAIGDERRQLMWLTLVVVPLPLFVLVSLYAAPSHQFWLLDLATWGYVMLIPLAAGASVLRFRLYDVDRIVAATITYTLVTLVLLGVYAWVVWVGATLSAATAPSPTVTATIGAVVAALLAAPLRKRLQERVDRQFNRRAYDAERVVKRGLAVDKAGLDIEALLRDALQDPTLRIAYPSDEGWLDGRGGPALDQAPDPVEVTRSNRVVARISYDPAINEQTTVRRLGHLAAAELDNTALRTEQARHLTALDASRRRIAEATLEERNRIERDLHDGAQQRLLGAAAQLRAAAMNGDADRMRQALEDGVTQCRLAVVELRELANGLYPSLLRDGGLTAALGDLSSRLPVRVLVDDPEHRWSSDAELTAWFVATEAVSNAVKHAVASTLHVRISGDNSKLVIEVVDDGIGGTDPDGHGVRGLRDRVEAQGGQLHVTSRVGAGTTVRAVIPCAS